MSTSSAPAVYPVHVDADLDPGLSRGLWLVKWILVIPHYLVLPFLWVAFLAMGIVAFFAILFTGRYPRAVFDFNLGVLRWSWRVTYYAYGALGTDRYPPFTLADVPDYPAHLEVDYPEHLSRGLVLVKWWLLAIPHYLVLALFAGGAVYGAWGADEEPLLSVGLIDLLVLVAGVALLFTGRYPPRIFDLVLGLNRWALRVAGYVSLMTDRYPPFSLDQGGHEHHGMPGGTATMTPAAPPRPASAPAPGDGAPSGFVVRAPDHRSGWTGGRVVSVILGSLLVLGGLGLTAGGAALVAADQLGRDADGFLMSPPQRLTVDGFAITSVEAAVHTDGTIERLPDALIGNVRVSAAATGHADLFVGIASATDAQAYLGNVRHDTLLRIRNGDPVYRSAPGGPPVSAPTEQDFWVARATGAHPDLTWTPRDGDWTVVIMNTDGSAVVTGDVSAGAEVPMLSTVITVLFCLAGFFLLVGALLIAVPVRSINRT